MIPRTDPAWHIDSSRNWQQQLQTAITDPEELLIKLNLPLHLLPAAKLAAQQFPLRVPHAFVNRIQPGNINDPLLRQILPIEQELIAKEGFSADPVAEQGNTQPGLIQKYHGRVLLMLNGHCAVNCRYCFRRHFPYDENKLSRQEWLEVIRQIREDSTIDEVIYSGGDPLASSDRQLKWLTEQIATIPHVKRLRIHTRLPVVIPDRITDECLSWMSHPELQTVVVLHINHAQEIDYDLTQAIARLKSASITLLNQAVLLKGVNDHCESQTELSLRLFDTGVLPYYLHLLDPVAGASHFDILEEPAEKLYREMLAALPGYLVPRLVREVAGENSKLPIALLS